VPARRPAHAPAALPDRSRRQTTAQTTTATAERDAAPLRDHGLSLIAIFTVAMLVMVGLAVLTAIVGQWWVLVPVMIVDLAATTAVLASIASLLGDGDGHSR
jgi:Flp pilus assembly protein TadB